MVRFTATEIQNFLFDGFMGGQHALRLHAALRFSRVWSSPVAVEASCCHIRILEARYAYFQVGGFPIQNDTPTLVTIMPVVGFIGTPSR